MISKFPSEAPKRKVIRTMQKLGFEILREKEHISMIRIESDGKRTPLTLPNHSLINGALLRLICTQAGISRDEFIEQYNKS
ncbi:MAG: type II toxin-antitoxin system HicA family toxin [bacterium]